MAIIVSTPEDLEAIRNNLNGHYIQANNINLSGHLPGDPLRTWNPIDNFTGIYDGNCYGITGVHLNRLGHIGFFGQTGAAEIKNLFIEVNSLGGQFVGGLIGTISGGLVSNCSVSGILIEGQNHVGGFVGAAENTSFYDCTAEIEVISHYLSEDFIGVAWVETSQGLFPVQYSALHAGGFCGVLNPGNSLEYCRSFGDVTCSNDWADDQGFFGLGAGGLVAMVSDGNTISKCYSIGFTTATATVGGLIGSAYEQANITNCYSLGVVDVHTNKANILITYGEDSYLLYRALGGFIGNARHYLLNIERCYCAGEVRILTADTFLGYVEPWDRGWKQSGGFAGSGHNDVSVYNNYYDETESAGHTDNYLADPKTVAEMETKSTFVDWDFENIWEITGGYPYLRWPTNICESTLSSQMWVKKDNLWQEVKRH